MTIEERLAAVIFNAFNATNPLYYDDAADELTAALLPEVEKMCREAVREEREATLSHIARFPGTITLYDDIGRGMHRIQREEDSRE